MPVYTYTTLDDPFASTTNANGINDAGQVVGTYADSRGLEHGFLYSGGIYTTLDDPSATGTFANGINGSGQRSCSQIDPCKGCFGHTGDE